MKKLLTIFILSLFAQLTFGQKDSNRFAGKIYESVLDVEMADGIKIVEGLPTSKEVEVNGDTMIVFERGQPIEMWFGGSTSKFCVLTFERDSVLISLREKQEGALFEGNEYDISSEKGKFPYKVINQTIKIKNTSSGFQSEEIFILTIEDEGQMLVADEKTNPFEMCYGSFLFKGFVRNK
jgi:hypothetical protein